MRRGLTLTQLGEGAIRRGSSAVSWSLVGSVSPAIRLRRPSRALFPAAAIAEYDSGRLHLNPQSRPLQPIHWMTLARGQGLNITTMHAESINGAIAVSTSACWKPFDAAGTIIDPLEY